MYLFHFVYRELGEKEKRENMLHVGRLQICSTYVGAPEAFILIFILSCTHGYATDIKIEPSITNYPTTMQHSFEH